jgi:hypothetical protein
MCSYVYWTFATVLFVIATSNMAELPLRNLLLPCIIDVIMIVTGTYTKKAIYRSTDFPVGFCAFWKGSYLLLAISWVAFVFVMSFLMFSLNRGTNITKANFEILNELVLV